jgi:hypothetical protein
VLRTPTSNFEIRANGDPGPRFYKDMLGFETFEACCNARWDFTGRHVKRLMAAAEVIDNTRPIGRIPDTETLALSLARLTHLRSAARGLAECR